MKKLLAPVLAGFVMSGVVFAVEPAVRRAAGAAAKSGQAGLLGSISFSASPEQPYGWRGDGSGRFVGATPPIQWGRTIKNFVTEMTFQTAKPKAAAAGGAPLKLGAVHEWLIIGPFPVKEVTKDLADECMPKETEVEPDAGQKVGQNVWKAVAINPASGGVSYSQFDFAVEYGMKEKKEWQNHPGSLDPVVAYAHAYVYSATGGKAYLRCGGSGTVKAWFNGNPVKIPGQWDPSPEVEVKKGWNRLLAKVGSSTRAWDVSASFAPIPPYDYETKNFAWIAGLPEWSLASPVIAGNRLFVTSEPCDVICLNKPDGKLLWIRGSSFFETLTADEKKQLNADALKQAEALAGELKAANEEILKVHNKLDWKVFNAASASERQELEKVVAKKRELDKKLMGVIRGADEKKYYFPDKQRYGWTTPTPITDGKNVFVAFSLGIVACYEIDGNRKWVTLANEGGGQEHGSHSSPVISDGKVVWMMNDLVTAFDIKTGAKAWSVRTGFRAHGGLNAARVGRQNLILTAAGTILNAADGEIIWKQAPFGLSWCTPVFDGTALYGCSGSGWKLSALMFPQPFDVKGLSVKPLIPETSKYKNAPIASPLSDNGLLYSIDLRGVLKVNRISDQSIVYEMPLDMMAARFGYVDPAGVCASPSLAGKRIYVMDNSGNWIVFEPGPEFKIVAQNRVANILHNRGQEQTIGTPVFEGNRIYYRGAEYLYCIEGK